MVRGKKGGWFAVFAIILLLVVIVSLFVYFLNNKKDKEEEIVENITINYPLKIRSKSDTALDYVIFDPFGVEVDRGKLTPGIVENYLDAIFNWTYQIHVTGENHYYETVSCMQFAEDDICFLNPSKHADMDVWFSDDRLNIRVTEGIVRESLVCATWDTIITSVKIYGMGDEDYVDLENEKVPKRVRHLIDRCYYLGNITEHTVLHTEIVKGGRDDANITFWIIDQDVDEDFDFTYDVDTGIPDFTYIIEI